MLSEWIYLVWASLEEDQDMGKEEEEEEEFDDEEEEYDEEDSKE